MWYQHRSATTAAAVTTAMPTTTVATTAHVVYRRTNLHVDLSLVLEFVSLECDQVYKHIIKRERLGLGHRRSDKGIIGGRKTYE